jgi:hypothetical protein
MNNFFDVLVPKQYEAKQNGGATEKRTAWNKVGRAWMSRTLDSITFELYMHPNQRYVISLKDKDKENDGKKETRSEK